MSATAILSLTFLVLTALWLVWAHREEVKAATRREKAAMRWTTEEILRNEG